MVDNSCYRCGRETDNYGLCDPCVFSEEDEQRQEEERREREYREELERRAAYEASFDFVIDLYLGHEITREELVSGLTDRGMDGLMVVETLRGLDTHASSAG